MLEPSQNRGRKQPFGSPGRDEDLVKRLQILLTLGEKKGIEALSAPKILEIGALHRALGTQLAKAREFHGSARALAEMNALFARSHKFLYVKSSEAPSSLIDVIARFPEIVRRTWPFHLLSLTLFSLAFFYSFLGTQADPEWGGQFLLPGDMRTPFADRGALLEAILRGRDGGVGIGSKTFFASFLWIHNTKVALMSFFSGAVFGLPTLYFILSNGLMLGVYSEIYVAHDLGREWAAWVLPHGVTEMGGLILFAGGGLWIGWLLISPGDRTRLGALRDEASGILALALGVFPMLLIAGLLESFLRQSSLSDSFRLVFAAVSGILWLVFFLVVRPSSRRVRGRLRSRSLAARAIPLPEDEDLLRWLEP
jgi:uncharacterized membrane protein SpoIIM required for sporulation